MAALPGILCLICDFCPSGQRFAFDCLQIPPRDGHPCLQLNTSHYQGRVRDFHPLDYTHTGRIITKQYLVNSMFNGRIHHCMQVVILHCNIIFNGRAKVDNPTNGTRGIRIFPIEMNSLWTLNNPNTSRTETSHKAPELPYPRLQTLASRH